MGMATNNEFAARLARIEAGGENTRHTMFVGMDEKLTLSPEQAGSLYVEQLVAPKKSAKPLISVIVALMLGILGVFLGSYAEFYVLGLPTELDADTMLVIEAALAMCIAFGLGQAFRLSSMLHLGANAAGVLAAICLMHNVVHLYPDLFARVFAPEWTEQVISTTELHTVVFRGKPITF